LNHIVLNKNPDLICLVLYITAMSYWWQRA